MNNLKSYTEYAVTSSTRDFVIGFDFNYGTDAVNVTVDGVPATEAGYTVVYLNSTTMRLTPAVTSGVVRLQRETNIDVPDNKFTAGAKFIASNMDENFKQIRQSQQEVRDAFDFLEYSTLSVVEAAKDATDRILDIADNAHSTIDEWRDAIDTITHGDGVPALAVSDASGISQQRINDLTGAPYRVKAGGYNIGERVVLANGDIVENTVAGNTANPNSNMSGWVNPAAVQKEINNSKTVKSIADLKNAPTGFSIYLESVVAGKQLGSGWFYWAAASTEAEDTATVVTSNKSSSGRWKRVAVSDPNPTWWGCTGSGADADNFKKAVDWSYAQKKRLTIDSKISLEKQIDIWGIYGWDVVGGGEFVITADVTPLRILSLPKNVTFYKTKVSTSINTANNNAFAIVSLRYQVEGLKVLGFEFAGTNNSWDGIVFQNNEGSGSGGLSGGSMFVGFNNTRLKSSIRFKNSTYNYFVNATTFQNIRDSYSNDQILVEVSIAECVFINCTSQENLISTINSTDTGRINRSTFNMVHNWDNNIPAVILSKSSVNNILMDVYPNKLLDYGFFNSLTRNAQSLKTSTVATYRDEFTLSKNKTIFGDIFNIQEGTLQSGFLGVADGQMSPALILQASDTESPAMLFAQNEFASASGFGVFNRYSQSKLEVLFKLQTTDLDNYSIMIGLVGSVGAVGAASAFAGGIYLTNIGGNFAVVQHTGSATNLPSSNFTTLYTLGALDGKMHSFGVSFVNYQSTRERHVMFDDVALGTHTANSSVNRSPVIAVRGSEAKPTTLGIVQCNLIHTYNQGWL